jgi:hypothetical protein
MECAAARRNENWHESQRERQDASMFDRAAASSSAGSAVRMAESWKKYQADEWTESKFESAND